MGSLYDGELHPHGGQYKAWISTKRFIAMLAGTQGGKTCFEPWWLANEITRRGAGDYLAVTTSFDLFKLKFLPEMRSVFEDTLHIGRYWASSRIIEIASPSNGFLAKNQDDKMWARIILRSIQSDGGLESATAKAAVLDEAGQDEWTLEHWEAILRRLALNEGRVLIGTTPYNMGWLYNELYLPWERGESQDIEIIQFPSIMNPAFPPKEFERMRRTMQDWRFDMFCQGLFAKPPSMIYGCVGGDHWVEPFDIPWNWPVVVGVDPSGGHCATLWLANRPNTEQWFAFHETLDHELTTAQNVSKARGLLKRGQEAQFVGGGPSEGQERLDWSDNGIDLQEPSVTSVDAGIDRAVSMFKGHRLKLFNSLHMLRDEIGGYRRKVDDQGNVLAEIVDKRKYHLLDCLRAAASLIEEGDTTGQDLERYLRRVQG